MALSKAQKLRKKAEREGRLEPSGQRLGWNGVNPITKVTPTKLERLQRLENKHKRKRNGCHGDDGSVFCNGSERRYNRTQRFYAPILMAIVLELQAITSLGSARFQNTHFPPNNVS
jgi:hypothetical protein